MLKADEGGVSKTDDSRQSNPRGDVSVIIQLALDLDECKAEVIYFLNLLLSPKSEWQRCNMMIIKKDNL